MSDKTVDEEGGYEVGKGKPPKHTQWQKGQSGNPNGRPKSRKSDAIDIESLLDETVKARVGGKETEMPVFEASFRQVAIRAIEGHLPSIRKFLRTCEEYGVIAPSPQREGGVVFAPKGVDLDEWLDSVTEWVPADDDPEDY